MNTVIIKRSTCARCGAAIKYEYEYNGEIYGSTCIFRELGIKFSDEELIDIRINYSGNINSYFREKEQAEQKAKIEKKRCIEENTEIISNAIRDLNLDLNINDISVTENLRVSVYDIIHNTKVKANGRCKLFKKILQHGVYNDYYHMIFAFGDYEIYIDTTAKKIVELQVGDSCKISFAVEKLFINEKQIWGKRPKIN